MNELNTRTLIRRDSLSITESDNLINETRDAFSNYVYASDLESSEDFFDLDLSYLNNLPD